MTTHRIIDRTKAGLLAVFIALSLVVSSLPASASFAKNAGWDFIDATAINWERGPKNITWEGKPGPKPTNITWESAWESTLRNITWE